MARASKDEGSRFGRAIGIFLLWNMIPLGVGVWLLYRHLSGDLPPLNIPEGLTFNLWVLGGALLALILVASLSLPASHKAVKGSERAMRRSRAILAGREPGSRLLSLLVLPPLGLFWALGATARTLLIITSLFLIAVTILFMVRLFMPDLLQDVIEQVLAWRPL